MYYNMTMNIPFNIKFTIFDENEPLTKQQIDIMKKLLYAFDNDLKKILKHSITDLPDFKFLARYEPAISNFDETKQLRLTWMQPNAYKHSLHFNQCHSLCTEYFSIEELKNISNRIKTELEEYLHHEIDTVLYVELDSL